MFNYILMILPSSLGLMCPSNCPMKLKPICGISFDGKRQTFANECAMRVENCQTKRGLDDFFVYY